MRNMRRKGGGFTLIELLVVIAIIAILAAILFPIFMNAKRASQRSACINNLRQLGAAAGMYADAYNGFYPPARSNHWPFGTFLVPWPPDGSGYTSAHPCLAIRALEPYVKNNRVFSCPSNIFFKPEIYWGPGTTYYSGYCYWADYHDPQLKEGMVAENTGRYPNALVISDIVITSPTASRWNSHEPNGVPTGGNYLYNDGHVKWKWFGQMQYLLRRTGPPAVDFYY